MKNKITVDGNTAAALIAYKLSEVACIYPITPSSTMSELCSLWSNEGRKNIFGLAMTVKEMQSEAGASGAVHGSLACGALSTTFTSSQGLLLMIPNMYKIAGELLPCVFHVSARAIATHALSIFGDHSDVMAVRQTGFGMICSSSVQECHDMALASHIITLSSSVPFVHFFDGFRTSHEIKKIEEINESDILKMYPFEKVLEFKKRALDPLRPHQQGTAQNPDIFFQNREACNSSYQNVYKYAEDAFAKIEKITGRHYEPFEYYGAPDAENVVVIMGSGSETCIDVANDLCGHGEKVGVLKVRLFRPFNAEAFANKLPKTVKKISVLDRTKEASSPAEPLCQDVIYAINKSALKCQVVGGRYGLGSKEFLPSDAFAVFENLKQKNMLDHFSVGINDDVTHLSLPKFNYTLNKNEREYIFYGLGSDGTVSANKNTIKIIGDCSNLFCQGYFEYDSKKSGSLTTSHLRISDSDITSPYTVQNADLIEINNFSFVNRYDLTKNLKKNSAVILNTVLNKDSILDNLPEKFINDINAVNAKLYIINAQEIAEKVGLGNKINVIMQTAFFKLTDVINFSVAKKQMQEAIKDTYGKKGDEVIQKNLNAIEIAESSIILCDTKNYHTKAKILQKETDDKYYNNFIKPIENLRGNDLPVSVFNKSGHVPTDTSKLLKRGIANHLPCWISENCIQCGMCTTACPHSVIEAKLIDEKNLKEKPESFNDTPAIGAKGLEYKLQISPLDCTGCGVCSEVCPAKNKAILMKPAGEILDKEQKNYEYFNTLPQAQNPFNDSLPKGLQFKENYFKFSGACAGCGETPYIKLASQLFGKDMIIANATGCSSIYGGNAPACPYLKDSDGNGPAWANSLFEDNAEFGFGMSLAVKNNKLLLYEALKKYLLVTKDSKISNLIDKFAKDNFALCHEDAKVLCDLIEKEQNCKEKDNVLRYKDYLTKKSIWIIGGDGWAYDIGFGGLDHLLSTNENVNILVLDSEVYSNTGGQASKGTPKGATARFASEGKTSMKKNLAHLAMEYKNVYVASVSLGANMSQAIKAFKEAEAYNGVSIIIAYSPCINHGIDMSKSSLEMKKAVDCGYWNLFRFNPDKKSPLEIDSAPFASFKDFLLGESRFKALYKTNPEHAEDLLAACENDAKYRREMLEILEKFYNKEEN